MWDLLPLVLIAAWCIRSRNSRGRAGRLFADTGPHWRRCYNRRSFLRLGGAVLIAGTLAYSGADEAVERWHSGAVRTRFSDRLASFFKPWGARLGFACWALLAAVDTTWRSSAFSRWGRCNFEAMLVGLPLLWTTQRALGSNRPSSQSADPRWRPLADEKGASGHTFMAAIPWLNLARRTGDRGLGAAARFGSLLTGWSRLNDRMHYLSQIWLGYHIALTAVNAVGEKGEEE